MTQYTYDPTQGKVVPLSQARVVTKIITDPDEQTKKAAAAAAVTAAQGAGISTKFAGGGATDSQNEARLEAAKAYALSPAGIRAALDKIKADEEAQIIAAKSPYNVKSTAGDELLRNQGAASAATAAQGAGIPIKSGGGGFTDSQNAARLAAQEKTRLTALGGAETDSQNAARLEAARAYALSPAGIRAALDKITADEKARLEALGGAETDSQNAARLAAPRKVADDAQKAADDAKAAAAANPGNRVDAKVDQAAADAAQKEADEARAVADAADAQAAADKKTADEKTADEKTADATATANANANAEIPVIIDEKNYFDGPTPVAEPGDYTTVNGILNFKGSPFSGQYNGKYYTDGKESLPKGAAWTWNGKAFVQPPMPTDGKTYTWNDAKGWVASTLNTATITATQTDSIAGLIALLGSYGIGDLGDAITKAIINGYSADTIQLIMQDPNSNDPLAVAFQKRFPANKILASQGKAVLSPGEYLAAERRYTEIMQSYGVAGLATRATLSDFIANSISATEVSDRVGLAVDRVQNADAETKKMLATYYPMLNTNDIVTAMLNPKEGLPALKRKVQIAEIGGAALSQGLNTSINSMSMKSALYSNVQSGALGAQQLAEFGVTKEQARAGYQQVAEITPRAEFLSSISGGEDYTRLEAEQEAFLGLASAKRARENLVKQEQGRFAGSSGLTKNSLSSSTKGQY